MKRLYLVTEQNGDKPKQHLVNASTRERAIDAIAKPRFTVTIPTPADLIALTKAGVNVVEV